MSRPNWLPDPFVITGDWDQDLANLYKVFENGFKHRRCVLRGARIIFDNRVLEGDYEEGFWHLITKDDQQTGERLFDARRAECLPWFFALLTNSEDESVKTWNWKESNGKTRTYIWLEEFDYVIIIEQKRKIYFLVTAHHVDGDSTRRKLRRRYEDRES